MRGSKSGWRQLGVVCVAAVFASVIPMGGAALAQPAPERLVQNLPGQGVNGQVSTGQGSPELGLADSGLLNRGLLEQGLADPGSVSHGSVSQGLLASDMAVVVTGDGIHEWALDLPPGHVVADEGEAWRVTDTDGALLGVVTKPRLIGDGVANAVVDESLTGQVVRATVTGVPVGAQAALVVAAERAGDEAALGEMGDAGAAEFVDVPADYDYNPLYWPWKYRGQHDYCSFSPDGMWFAPYYVNFRGPCAIHDMCYEEFNDLPHADKVRERTARCQGPFRDNMVANCHHQIGPIFSEVNLLQCRCVAHTYHAAVSLLIETQP